MTPPLQTELHRHLDVSLRVSTLLELAQQRGLEGTSTSLESFRAKLEIRQPMSDLAAVLAQFQLFQLVQDRPDVLERVAYEVIQDCRAEGTRQVELRFSPSFVCEFSKLNWEDALDGYEAGLQRALRDFPEMRAGLICIATRDYGVDSVEETINFFLKHQHRFIGVDLAGNEIDQPTHRFENAFRRARDAEANITIHAGEAGGPENVWEAVELLGASRIGHGIHSIEDPQLLGYLATNRICLEICPTSNWLTQCVKRLEDHPLPKLLKSGVPVSINTDDPGIFGVTLPGEISICREKMGLTESDIHECIAHAARHSFL